MNKKTSLIIAVVAALAASGAVALSQRVTVFYDHQGVSESGPAMKYIALQTPGDVAASEPTRYHAQWTGSMENFFGDPARVMAAKVASYRAMDAKIAAANRVERQRQRVTVAAVARPVAPTASRPMVADVRVPIFEK